MTAERIQVDSAASIAYTGDKLIRSSYNITLNEALEKFLKTPDCGLDLP
jgi:hypothetical protein